MANRIAGITRVTCDGVAYRVKGSVEIMGHTIKREGVIGADGEVHGVKETGVIPGMTLDITFDRGTSLRALQLINGSTITCEGPTGAQFILGDAWYSGEGKYSPGEGEAKLEFQGSYFREVPAR